MRDLTKAGLLTYLVSNPEKVHKCGNASECVLAQYIVDELAEDSDFGGPLKQVVDVDGFQVGFYSTTQQDGYELDAESTLIELPEWAGEVVEVFDGMESESEDEYENAWWAYREAQEEAQDEGREFAEPEPSIEVRDEFTGAEVLNRLREAGIL